MQLLREAFCDPQNTHFLRTLGMLVPFLLASRCVSSAKAVSVARCCVGTLLYDETESKDTHRHTHASLKMFF